MYSKGIRITIRYYEFVNGFRPDYSKPHDVTFDGKTAAEAMAKCLAFSLDHDISKYTHTEIVYVADII